MKVLATAAAAVIVLVCGALGTSAQEVTSEKVIQGGILNGKANSLPKPEYPAHLRDQRIGGSVAVNVVIDESGIVVSATAAMPLKAEKAGEGLIEAQIDPALIAAAEDAARSAQFAPTMLNGVPVKVKGTIVYNFAPARIADNNDPRIVTGGVLNGKAVSLPLPAYPAAAKAVGAAGSVNVAVTIDETGNVIESEAISGHPLLRSAAVEAARGAQFSPTMLSGTPVKVKGVVVYNFVP